MQIYYVPQHLKQILHYTDDAGRFAYATDYSEQEEKKFSGIEQKALIAHMFGLTQLYLDREHFLTPDYLDKFQAKFEVITEDTPQGELRYFLFSANVLGYFGLPGTNPKEEIDTLFKFFSKISNIYESFYQTFPDYFENVHMQIFNSGANLFESLEFLVKKDYVSEQAWLDEKSREILSDIQASPALTAWLTHTRYLLDSIGPHSWQNYDSCSFFNMHDNPQMKRWHETPEKVKLFNDKTQRELNHKKRQTKKRKN